MSPAFSRRTFVWSAGLVGLVSATDALPRVGGEQPREAPDLSLPANNLRELIRMQASLREQDVPWWYDGTIYAVEPGKHPQALFRFEGMEIYWMRHLPGGDYELIGNTVTFYRDLATGEWLDTFENPFTGKINAVTPAVQGGGPGRGFNYSVKGIRFTKLMDQLPERPLVLDWSFVRDVVWMHNETAYPPGLPPPRAQRQTMFAPVASMLDDSLDSLPALFSSTVIQPWPKWMEMGDRPGHVVWHASGAKLGSIDELPGDYRRRAERDHAALMTANPAGNARPPSDLSK
ncbi:MAG: DUF1838 domain-containing protein [Gammaproteobacteria bacterium]|nr:DUF1838 domain-containing protein [Gammaproteobacteria bacterium]